MDVVDLPLEQIIPYAHNPRRNEQAIATVAASIQEFGWRQPIVVDKALVVFAGHMRLEAARKLGFKSAPVHVAKGLTEAQPGRIIYDWRHYLAVVQRKPSALRNGAPFVEMPDAFRQLQGQKLRKPGGDREMVEILSLVLHHDEQAVLCAVEMALEAGVPIKTHVLNVLHRLVDGTPTDKPDVTPPAALSLSKEPEANVARYDGCLLYTSPSPRDAHESRMPSSA